MKPAYNFHLIKYMTIKYLFIKHEIIVQKFINNIKNITKHK